MKGNTTENIDILLTDSQLSLDVCQAFVASPLAGAVVHFVGTVRNQTQERAVQRLDFEAYRPMAMSEMQKIAETLLSTFAVKKVAIHHRIGSLEIGEIPVIIAVSAAHRGVAFTACQYAIDMLKETVPIWKKEIFEDGEVWVSATP